MRLEKIIFINGNKTTYKVTSDGKVFNYKTNKYLSPSYNHKGYKMVVLYVDGEPITRTIHKLVALAFIPNPDNLPVVNHINGVKTDNNYTNLEWCTYQYNTRHAWKTGLTKALRGSINGHSKYNDDQIIKVCEMLADNKPLKEIKKETGVKGDTITKILYHNQWPDISCKYKFDKDYYKSLLKSVDADLERKIENCLLSGILKEKDIKKKLNIPDNKSIHSAYKRLKSKHKLTKSNKSSTTIENDDLYTIEIH